MLLGECESCLLEFDLQSSVKHMLDIWKFCYRTNNLESWDKNVIMKNRVNQMDTLCLSLQSMICT